MNCEVSVVLPCYNESKNIGEMAHRLSQLFLRKQLSGEIVLVDDGSTDDTYAVMQNLAQQYKCVVLQKHDRNRGIAQAWKTGTKAATGKYVCFMDADLQNLPEDVWRLYREITYNHADLVQGNRSLIGRHKDSRYWFSVGLNSLLNGLFEMRQKDNKSGFVIAKKDVMEDILRHRFNYYYFQTFITVAAAAKGYTIREVETIFDRRLLGESFMSAIPIVVVIRALIDIVKAYFEYRVAPKRDTFMAEFLETHKPLREDAPMKGCQAFMFWLFFATTWTHKWLITSRAKDYYYELKRTQYLSHSDIRKLQGLKLRRLMNHAYNHVGYWRELLDAHGLVPEEFNSVEDLRKLPLLSKQTVKDNIYFDMLSDNHDKAKILKVSTSGSTGEPFVCFADQHQLEIRWATTQRSYEWTGWKWGDRCTRLWHQTIGMSLSQIIREAIDAWFCNRKFIPAFEMSDESIKQFSRKVAAHKPFLIDGYAESFNFLAYSLQESKEPLKWKPKALLSSAQSLPPASRQIIEQNFGCKVFDKYGSREFSGIAYECDQHTGHHIMAESYIVEIIKDGKPAKAGEVGEVVVTDLNNYCMPLIRYRVGDLAVAMDEGFQCPCGRGLPLLGEIQGRTQAIIFGTNGTYMPGSFFLHVLKDYSHLVSQLQVVQEVKGELVLKIVKAKRWDDDVFNNVVELMKRHLGQDMQINLEFVDNIPLGRTGKRQPIVSKIAVDFQKVEAVIAGSDREEADVDVEKPAAPTL